MDHSTMLPLIAFEDCPICLDEMNEADLEHPLQCRMHCGYNFCAHCIESLISSSKDDYLEASDGNRHVKVFLNCPNCRSDLSTTIRDTLLLRKVDALREKQQAKVKLDESQERLSLVLNTTQVQAAIWQARKLEAEYFGREILKEEEKEEPSTIVRREPSILYEEEWGVEADLIVGVHESFHMPRAPSIHEVDRSRALQIDPTLFSGLDYCLEDEERKQITEMMTSGNPDNLSQAAQQLWAVAFHRQPVPTDNLRKRENSEVKSTFMKRSSVIDLIEESEVAHGQGKVEEVGAIAAAHTAEKLKMRQYRQFQQDYKQQVAFQQRFPLPVRMPKSVTLETPIVAIQSSEKKLGVFPNLCVSPASIRSHGIELIDYEWDGTALDAYCKISIAPLRGKITQKKTFNQNVKTVLGNSTVPMELPGQPRVLIGQAGRQAGQQGAVRGDVVTHIDGVSVLKQSAAEVLETLREKTDGSAVVVTLNAERSVAEALKRRAMIISEML